METFQEWGFFSHKIILALLPLGELLSPEKPTIYLLIRVPLGHVLGEIMGYSAAFNAARSSDYEALDAYQQQAGNNGLQETFAESFANYFGNNERYSASHPNLYQFWEKNSQQ